jgi:predicted aldo/keto reductase-like oxidoreductase
MHYRTMPKNGDELSVLGFGCMRFPMLEDGAIHAEKAIEQVRHAIDNGVNYLDTAWPYHGGASETIVGSALQGGYRDRVKIATKLPTWLISSREDMDYYLDKQLEKLQTERIDYYLLHALNGRTWDKLATLGVAEFLDAAVADGRIVNTGFSFHGVLEDFKRIVDSYPWVSCQIQYNYLDQEYQAGTEGLQYAAERNLGIVIMEPLRGGNLGLPEPPPAIGAIWDRAETERTPVEWALRWIWNHPEVTLVLSGMNEDAHIEENLRIADQAAADSLTPEECELVDQAAAAYKKLMKVDCTGCGYCLPCPEAVMIPAIFEVYNKMHLFGRKEEAKFIYAVRMCGVISGAKPGFASECVQCGECLEKCPQSIPIPDILEDVVVELEGPGMDDRVASIHKMFKA